VEGRRRRQSSVSIRSGPCPHHLAAAIKEVRDASPTGIRHRYGTALRRADGRHRESCLGPTGGLRRRDNRAKHCHCNRQPVLV
jgi:hypothetical protein